jgi:hypothetical protein
LRNILFLALALFLAACQPIAPPHQPESPIAQTWRVWLPYTVAGIAPTATPAPTPTPPACWPSAAEAEFYRLLVGDSRQQRPRLECDARLVAAARLRAAAQPPGGLSHCDSLGICANVYARAAGCRLPAHYTVNGNNIESLTGGMKDPAVAFASLAWSPSHAAHLFGQNIFFREQDRIGIALVEIPGWRWQYSWAILIARCETVATSGE